MVRSKNTFIMISRKYSMIGGAGRIKMYNNRIKLFKNFMIKTSLSCVTRVPMAFIQRSLFYCVPPWVVVDVCAFTHWNEMNFYVHIVLAVQHNTGGDGGVHTSEYPYVCVRQTLLRSEWLLRYGKCTVAWLYCRDSTMWRDDDDDDDAAGSRCLTVCTFRDTYQALWVHGFSDNIALNWSPHPTM